MSLAIRSRAPSGDWSIISCVGVAHGVSHFFHLPIPLLFPWLMPAFGLSFTQAGALTAVFFVISGLGQALAGLVVDRVGSRPVLLFGVTLLGLSGLVLGAAQNYAMLILAAALAGTGNCVFHPADFTILNRRISKKHLGHAFSVHGLSGNLGWALAPVFMTVLATQYGWRTAAFAASAVAVLPLLLLFFYLQPEKSAVGHGEGRERPAPAVSTWTVLRSPTVLHCFVFFFLLTVAFGAMQNFSVTALRMEYGLSLTAAAGCLTAYMLGAAAGIAAGGFLVNRPAIERFIAACIACGACISLLLAAGLIPGAFVLPLMALMGCAVGIAGPSRDLMVRQAATRGMGEASYGRVYGFVYSGIDSGQAVAPLIFGSLMDGGHYSMLWVGMAAFQFLAVLLALRVGRDAQARAL